MSAPTTSTVVVPGRYGPHQPCGFWRRGEYCGATPTRPFLFGPRCATCAPAYPKPDPDRTYAAMLARAQARRGIVRRYYDGSPGRETVICSDCGEPASAVFGDHSGPACYSRVDYAGRIRTDLEPGQYQLACMEIRRVAAARAVFSSNHTRTFMDWKHIPVPVRQRAFHDLLGTVMQPLDYEDSTEVTRRGAPPRRVRTYRSLIHQPAPEARELVSSR